MVKVKVNVSATPEETKAFSFETFSYNSSKGARNYWSWKDQILYIVTSTGISTAKCMIIIPESDKLVNTVIFIIFIGMHLFFGSMFNFKYHVIFSESRNIIK